MRDRRIILAVSIGILILLGCTCAPLSPTPAVRTTPFPTPTWADVGDRGGALLSEEQVIVEIYKRVAPSVVFVQVLAQDMPEANGSGAGFVYDTGGRIITNAHVVRDAEQVRVYFADDTVVEAEILGYDNDSDLAVLQVNVSAELLRPVEFASSADLQVGQLAIAIGNPYGYERTLTVGHISALGRVLRQESDFSVAEVIQTDASINPGNSGGPLLNSHGQVIGVNSYYQTSNPFGGSVGIGFAIPSDLVRLVVPDLIAYGRYRHPWLGISGYALTPDLVSTLNLPVEHGALVATVVEGGPAARAGIRGGTETVEVSGYPQPVPVGGDIIIRIDDVEVHGMDDLVTYLQRARIGQRVVLTILRGGKEMTISVELGERPVR